MTSGKTAEYYRVHLLSLPNELSRINNRKKLNPISYTTDNSVAKKRPILLANTQERICQALHDGDAKHLQELVLEGYGDSLYGRTSWGEEARKFLKGLPHLMDQIKTLHASVIKGDIPTIERILSDDSSLIRARDENGLLPIHMATAHNQPEVVSGRTALHISAQNKTIDIYRKVVELGGDPKIMDKNGKTADSYLRQQTIQNYDLVSPLNGKQLTDNIANTNGVGNGFAEHQNEWNRSNNKTQIKPVLNNREMGGKAPKPAVRTTRREQTNGNNLVVDTSNGKSTKISHKSRKPLPSVAGNRLPAINMDESIVGSDSKSDITSQTTSDQTSGSNTNTTISTASSTMSERTFGTEQDFIEAQVVVGDSDVQQVIDSRDESDANITDNEVYVNSEPSAALQMDESIVTDSDVVYDGDDGQQEGNTESPEVSAGQAMDDSSLTTGDESEVMLLNNEKKGDVMNGNEVSPEVNEDSRGLLLSALVEEEKSTSDTNGEQMNAQEMNSETIITDKDERDGESSDTNAIPEPQESDAQLNAADGNEADIKSNENIDDSTPMQTIAETNDENNSDGRNEESMAEEGKGTEPTLPEETVVSDDSQQQIGNEELVISDGAIVNTNETNDANNAIDDTVVTKRGSESRKSSLSSTGSAAKGFSRSLSQQSVTENKGSNSRRVSRTQSQESNDGKQSDSKPGSRPGTQSRRRQSQAEATPSSRRSSKSSAKSLPRQSSIPEVTADGPQELAEQMTENVINNSLDEMKKNESIDDSNEVIDDRRGSEPRLEEEISDTSVLAEDNEPNAEELAQKTTEQTNDENMTDNNEVVDGVVDGTDSTADFVSTAPQEKADSDDIIPDNNNETINQTVEQNDSQEKGEEDVVANEPVVTQTSDELEVKDNNNNNNEGNEEQTNEITDKSDEKNDSKEEEEKVEEEVAANEVIDNSDETINGENGSQVVNDHNNNPNNESNSEASTKLSAADDRPPQQSANSSIFDRSFSRQSAVSSINPQSDGLNDLIEKWLKDADLLRLEHVVIAGQGERLIGKKSANSQVQDFLDLVPTYMTKIRAVHDTVIRGNLNEVKHVLTRKRFALSRDHLGASPLHLAVLHGHWDVMVYIITQFPETINGPDNEGRTPLHYSAVLNDNQNMFYKRLCESKADPNIKDKSGYSAEYYLDNPGVLTIRQLLENYMPPDDQRRYNNSAEVWRRPPTADIESRLTPTPDDSDSSIISNVNYKHEVDAEVHVDGDSRLGRSGGSRLARITAYSRSLSHSSMSNRTAADEPYDEDDDDFETLSNDYKKSLKEEKERLQKHFDRQMSTSEAISMSTRVVDNIQDAQPPIGSNTMITNGSNSSGYDLTEIKDENGQTVLHQLAAKPHQRSVFYKMLSQAEYLIPERDAKYRTIRDITVENGIKDNLLVVDQYILDTFVKQDKDLVKAFALEGYNNLLTVVDAEGHDVIATLKRYGRTSMEEFVRDLAQFQKNRDELHTFIRHGYAEGVDNLVQIDSDLVIAKSERGRHALHLSILFANLDIINTLIATNPNAVNTPDNMGRTPLHYAMASSFVEEIGRILIRAGANRALRDVRMRTPSYYYVYKQEIRDIKEEEKNLTI
ncbi:unnamed protein product [Medioppia subpectinata]|uniref:Uncharacterized protein n=1 Tax=Medioppia subpectinata TaxID=1979941 RepID=A0A7R9PTA5_9ACAR|nr:unnamed protein product [Medioppia subpectinata]CAG2100231.1 unnamed protein product [Medioppia subpectinata]